MAGISIGFFKNEASPVNLEVVQRRGRPTWSIGSVGTGESAGRYPDSGARVTVTLVVEPCLTLRFSSSEEGRGRWSVSLEPVAEGKGGSEGEHEGRGSS